MNVSERTQQIHDRLAAVDFQAKSPAQQKAFLTREINSLLAQAEEFHKLAMDDPDGPHFKAHGFMAVFCAQMAEGLEDYREEVRARTTKVKPGSVEMLQRMFDLPSAER